MGDGRGLVVVFDPALGGGGWPGPVAGQAISFIHAVRIAMP